MYAQLPGWVGLQNNRPSSSVKTIASMPFCLSLPEMNVSRSLRPMAGRRTRISMPSKMPVFPVAPRWSTTSARVRSRASGLMAQPRSASRGRTPVMARVFIPVNLASGLAKAVP
ncbi:hypothetical protein A6A29_40580 [Streptomyces sp. TSRI0281]|nr:hypothetical protein A6A29_40580 [Streptomyces sp. TSRI0281]